MTAPRPVLREVVTAARGLASREVHSSSPMTRWSGGTSPRGAQSLRAPHSLAGCGAHLARLWPALALIGAAIVLVAESLVVR